MRYGNCLIGALILARRARFRGRLRALWPSESWVPHILFEEEGGRVVHYYTVRDFLPWPWCYLWYQGRFGVWTRGLRRGKIPPPDAP